MKKVVTLCLLFAVGMVSVSAAKTNLSKKPKRKMIPLPAPKTEGGPALTEALAKRRSIRNFDPDRVLTDAELGQLCWAAQGINRPGGRFRTCPSAGATYPLEMYIVTARGVYHYLPKPHAVEEWAPGDLRGKVQSAALNQPWVGRAPAVFVLAADFRRTAKKYGARAKRYVHIEAGHAAQNLHLQAVALNLGSVPVGAFIDRRVAKVLGLPALQTPLYLVPIGQYPKVIGNTISEEKK